jgi:hypothetical protein
MNDDIPARSFQEIQPGLFRWEFYSPEHKVELSSHAVLADGKLLCFDPIPLADEPFAQLSACGRPAAIFLTNENHERDCVAWRERWQTPIWAAPDAALTVKDVMRFQPGRRECGEIDLHFLEGGAGGEVAFRFNSRSLLIFGDAVVNLPLRKLELLPAKYCRDQQGLRRSLAKLVREPFEHMAMAHGMPVLGKAHEKLVTLLLD